MYHFMRLDGSRPYPFSFLDFQALHDRSAGDCLLASPPQAVVVDQKTYRGESSMISMHNLVRRPGLVLTLSSFQLYL